ncbi:hypothetical protein LDVICp205 [lymphocystis disease virus-China]|uniref:Uncharacterized protein n=1 Tax=lymphocystis disease virus-China TaxID=256729 RepID=Q677Q9_9VIRU|nr:hypothetical protein LDVICp205 [lymphocystis disease virus-China]AAU11048.1 hypothetical protein [lymphocystis disease virus-China]
MMLNIINNPFIVEKLTLQHLIYTNEHRVYGLVLKSKYLLIL